MTEKKLGNEYFEWMYHIVCNESYYKELSYRKLLYFLYTLDFKYTLERDANRYEDGIDFRYKFAYERGYNNLVIDMYLNNKPCSVLEMMIALAFRVEEQIMDNENFGNRTGQWFWNMIVSLGLGSMDDANFDITKTKHIIDKFLNRDYKKNGDGGLFTISKNRDMSSAEIWSQMMWYLDENYDFSI